MFVTVMFEFRELSLYYHLVKQPSFCWLVLYFVPVGELQRQKEFEVAMFMYRTGEQQNAYNAMNSIKTHG